MRMIKKCKVIILILRYLKLNVKFNNYPIISLKYSFSPLRNLLKVLNSMNATLNLKLKNTFKQKQNPFWIVQNPKVIKINLDKTLWKMLLPLTLSNLCIMMNLEN